MIISPTHGQTASQATSRITSLPLAERQEKCCLYVSARLCLVPMDDCDSDITNLHFQAAVPKYLRLEMQPASGSIVKAGGVGVVEQVVRITNSMQVTIVFCDAL